MDNLIEQQMNALYNLARGTKQIKVKGTNQEEPIKINGEYRDLDNRCGKPHNNGRKDCLECSIIKENL